MGKIQVGFKISSRTARMLGRQNVSNQHVAVIELVKNAYDADATAVLVKFDRAGSSRGTIIIEDEGSGMDIQTIEDSWLTLGTDFKERKPMSPGGRMRTGAKGIGRFALDRLGAMGIMETFNDPAKDGVRLTIDWNKYDQNTAGFESILHDMETIPNTKQKTGTRLIIHQLRDAWQREDYETLHEDLVFLIPPLGDHNNDFKIDLFIDSEPDLSGNIEPLMREAAEYELTSTLSANGEIEHILIHHGDQRELIKHKSWEDVKPLKKRRLREKFPTCGPVEFKLLFYLRSSSEFRGLDFNLSSLRRYLDTFSGIRIYRDGFQVKPYGSKGNDWLNLNARKARSPEGVGQDLGTYRVNNNQLVGSIALSRASNANLEDKANREGLIETQAFEDLKDFLMDGIQFLELQRQYRERDEDLSRTKKEARLTETLDDLDRAWQQLVTTAHTETKRFDIHAEDIRRREFLQADEVVVTKEDLAIFEDNLEQLKENVASSLEENQLLRALATIGIALSTFSHEIQASVGSINSEIALTMPLLNGLAQVERTKGIERLTIAQASADRIQQWSNFVLDSVKKGHRKRQEIVIEELVKRVTTVFEPSFEYRSIVFESNIAIDLPHLQGFPIDLEAVLINLIANAIRALEGIPLMKRKIKLEINLLADQNHIQIHFDDSGKGIDLSKLPYKKGIEQIFDPFVTASGGQGTGMGLAVVSKVLTSIGATITATAKGVLGGAHFEIMLPVKK